MNHEISESLPRKSLSDWSLSKSHPSRSSGISPVSHRAKRDHHEELRLPKGGVRRSGSPIEVHRGPQDELQSQGRGSHIPRKSGRDVDPSQVGESPKNGACIRDTKVVHLWLCPRRGASGEDVGHRWWSERGNRKGRRRRPSPQRRRRHKTHCSHHSRRGGCLC